MKNITVSVPDEIYQAARKHAAELGTSVSALVTEYLKSLIDRDSEYIEREQLQNRVLFEIEGFTAADRLDRDAAHERTIS